MKSTTYVCRSCVQLIDDGCQSLFSENYAVHRSTMTAGEFGQEGTGDPALRVPFCGLSGIAGKVKRWTEVL